MTDLQANRPARQHRERNIVKRALDESDGSVEDATNRLFQLIIADKQFIQERLPEIVKSWCQDQIGGLIADIRLKAWTPPNADPAQRQGRISAAILTLLDFPLPGGKRLGDASRAEVEDGAEFYRKQAQDMAWKARWLSDIAQAMGRKRTVAAALDVSQLERMQEDSRGH